MHYGKICFDKFPFETCLSNLQLSKNCENFKTQQLAVFYGAQDLAL